MLLSKKTKAFILAGIMLFTIVFSALVIIVDSNHDCTIDDCRICQTIQLCLEKFRNTGKNNPNFPLHFACAVFFILFSFSVVCNDRFSTLVNQKVKLSN